MKRRIAILGSTGSIGTQALDVVRKNPDLFEVELLVAGNNTKLLAAQAREFDANMAIIGNEAKYEELKTLLEGTSIKVFAGEESICDAVGMESIDIVLTAMVGFAGLSSTVAAIKAGKAIALANKETLVAAGSIVMSLALENKCPILPVDSEHSAIFQCLEGSRGNNLKKILLTASGGPFRTWDKEKIAKCTVADALAHPNWSMGNKITIDSATMMNKGLEVIEAVHLFGVGVEQIEVLVHPQSIIHSMVEYDDSVVVAQLGHPNMREPISYALCYPQRRPVSGQSLNFTALGHLDFYAPDMDKFPCLALAREAALKKGNLPCIMNAANEVAVAAFLSEKIGFYDIPRLVEKAMNTLTFVENPSLEDIFSCNKETLEFTRSLI
ncbi:MAG: 1-deoxy-D-xylulose-5-phosphate reductoisomerase [Bacteroidales bacterium]|nr:1-deoxy-D-xylulose-5-phosphate reductoisomerase [Bacteroidales bacterium]